MNVEYVPEQLDVKGSALEAFSDVFARFQLPPESSSARHKPPIPHSHYSYDTRIRPLQQTLGQEPVKGEVIYSDDDMASEADSEWGLTWGRNQPVPSHTNAKAEFSNRTLRTLSKPP